jgi:hypothetical protein
VKAFLDTRLKVERSGDTLILEPDFPACCAAHSLAELHASLTGMRPPNRFRPDQAILVLDPFSSAFSLVSGKHEKLGFDLRSERAAVYRVRLPF